MRVRMSRQLRASVLAGVVVLAIGAFSSGCAKGTSPQDTARIDALKAEASRLVRENAQLRHELTASNEKVQLLFEQTRDLRQHWMACLTGRCAPAPAGAVQQSAPTPSWSRGGFADGAGAAAAMPASPAPSESRPTGPKVIIIGAPQPSGIASDEAVGAKCRQQWGSDYEMVKYCSQKQADAKGRLMSRNAGNAGAPLSVFDGIRSTCQTEWPTDYEMQDYCETKQLTAYSGLQRH